VRRRFRSRCDAEVVSLIARLLSQTTCQEEESAMEQDLPSRASAGLSASIAHNVSADDTARTLGSGDLDVLATPRLLAWLEEATCAAVAHALESGQSTVGTRVSLEHVRASPVGAEVTAAAELVHVDGRLLRFQVAASHADGVVVAHGEVTRVVVDAARFLARL
jgi:fluoroacetyl-CoA thioesterase